MDHLPSAPTSPTYHSTRGKLLLYRGAPTGRPVLTVEDYPKWYTLFLVHPGGAVEAVEYPGQDPRFDDRALLAHDPTMSGFADHCPNPEAVVAMADRLGWAIHERSFEAIIGRWETDALGHYSRPDYSEQGC